MNGSDRLVLEVAATYRGAIGFADVFTAEVKRVIEGGLEQPTIQLTVLPGDRETLSFLSEHPSPSVIEIAFARHRADEPYGTAQVTGFVDAGRTSWTIENVREAEG